MSRSFKKNPWIKDSKGNKWYNKVFRRTNKIRVTQGKDPVQMKELVNQWDVCDYKFMNNSDPNFKRK